MGVYDSSQFPKVKELIAVAQIEGQERLSILNADVKRTKEKIPQQKEVVDNLEGKVKDRKEIEKIASEEYKKVTKQVEEKNKEVQEAKEAYEKAKLERKREEEMLQYTDETAAIIGPSTC